MGKVIKCCKWLNSYVVLMEMTETTSINWQDHNPTRFSTTPILTNKKNISWTCRITSNWNRIYKMNQICSGNISWICWISDNNQWILHAWYLQEKNKRLKDRDIHICLDCYLLWLYSQVISLWTKFPVPDRFVICSS